MNYTDQQIIKGLIDKDNRITREFFFERCKPLFQGIIKSVFDGKMEYGELVNELYVYLMEDDAAKLKSFQYRCSVYQWLKVLAIRFFIRKRESDKVLDNGNHEPLYEENGYSMTTDYYEEAKEDMKRLIAGMRNKRYAFVLQRLVVEEVPTEDLADEMGITTDNLYNIKGRAIRQLTQAAINDIYYNKHQYEKH